jgi:hypothetical protein
MRFGTARSLDEGLMGSERLCLQSKGVFRIEANRRWLTPWHHVERLPALFAEPSLRRRMDRANSL